MFGTALTLGALIESVSKMLGHKKSFNDLILCSSTRYQGERRHAKVEREIKNNLVFA
jgi:hypothetical protein